MRDKKHSKLKKLVPQIGGFRTSLDLVRALREYDGHSSLMERQFVPPNFAEIRHILNLAQIHASSPKLKLATFDGKAVAKKARRWRSQRSPPHSHHFC